MLKYKIIIIGAGPSGSAAALELANLYPGICGEVLVLDKAVFPRPKLCAGGVTLTAEFILGQLGVRVDLPGVPVNVSRFDLPIGCLTVEQAAQFRIFDRAQFDNLLLRAAAKRGIVTQEGESVESIICGPEGIVVRTPKNEYQAEIVIGADGANSLVRRALGLRRTARVMMAMEIVVPTNRISKREFADNMAIFDFTVVRHGVPGYCWIFPTANPVQASVSLGIAEAPFRRHGSALIKSSFARWLSEFGVELSDWRLQAHPAIRYEPRAVSSRPRVLLVGDAAGTDPLFGEGITSALALGRLAASSAVEGLRRRDFSFSSYDESIRSSVIGIMMRRRRMIARRLYGATPVRWPNRKIQDLFKWVSSIDPTEMSATISWESSMRKHQS